jgi:hypothetical protein
MGPTPALRASNSNMAPAPHTPAADHSNAGWARRHVTSAASANRFPPPWTVEELDACFVVKDGTGQKLAYIYFDNPRAAAKPLIAGPAWTLEGRAFSAATGAAGAGTQFVA